MYRMQHKIRPNRETQYFAFGIALHLLMEEYYKNDKNIELALKALDKLEEKDYTVLVDTDDHRSLDRVKQVLNEYHERYINEPINIFKYEDEPIVEKSFSFPIVKIETAEAVWDVLYCGRIDGVIELSGKYFIFDHKTASAKPRGWLKKYEYPANQFIGYAVGASLAYDIRVSGAMVNLFHILKTSTNFDRGIVMFTNEQIEEWVKKVQDISEHMIKDIEADEYAMYSTGCYGMYGACMFHAICSAEKKIRHIVMEDDYVVDEWKPLEIKN